MAPFSYAGKRGYGGTLLCKAFPVSQNFFAPDFKSFLCWLLPFRFIVDEVLLAYLHTSFCNISRTVFGGMRIHSDGVSE